MIYEKYIRGGAWRPVSVAALKVGDIIRTVDIYGLEIVNFHGHAHFSVVQIQPSGKTYPPNKFDATLIPVDMAYISDITLHG